MIITSSFPISHRDCCSVDRNRRHDWRCFRSIVSVSYRSIICS